MRRLLKSWTFLRIWLSCTWGNSSTRNTDWKTRSIRCSSRISMWLSRSRMKKTMPCSSLKRPGIGRRPIWWSRAYRTQPTRSQPALASSNSVSRTIAKSQKSYLNCSKLHLRGSWLILISIFKLLGRYLGSAHIAPSEQEHQVANREVLSGQLRGRMGQDTLLRLPSQTALLPTDHRYHCIGVSALSLSQ
jgi:hypothetical protein